MLHYLCVEALLADAVLAEAISGVWSAELITDETAAAMWRECLLPPKADIGITNLYEPGGREFESLRARSFWGSD